MPSTPRPKKFVAVRPFSVSGESYAAGDEVPPGAALANALRYGDSFVEPERAKSTTPQPTNTNQE